MSCKESVENHLDAIAKRFPLTMICIGAELTGRNKALFLSLRILKPFVGFPISLLRLKTLMSLKREEFFELYDICQKGGPDFKLALYLQNPKSIIK